MNTVHSMAFSGGDQSDNWMGGRKTPSLSSELNRMLSAAVVSAAFRRLLLSDPVAALAGGYNGETFEVQADELAQIMLIRAGSLAEFAGQLLDRLWYGRSEPKSSPAQRQWNSAGPVAAVEEPVPVLAGAPHPLRRSQAVIHDSSVPPGRR